jgi:hypothetical protein
MRAEPARVGACVVDSLQFSQGGKAEQAKALKASGVDAIALYLGAATPALVATCIDAGLAVVLVTFAGEYNDGPNDEVAQLATLGIPPGATVFLDLEGLTAYHTDPPALIAKINAWADGIAAAGYMPGLYVGSPQPLTSAELHALRVTRYWRGQGRIVDRTGPLVLAEPINGWCMTQIYPSVSRGNTWVDCNMIGQDYKGRVPSWVV